jgi:dTDP-4-amino-4,6-dideoxygalactose transaminase
MGCFSFHPRKLITTAEGGAIVTNDPALADRLRLLRAHGMVRTDGRWPDLIMPGLNYRMTELQAALGLSQMQRLDAFVARRHQLAQRYDQLLANLPLTTPWQHPCSYSGLHLYVIRLQLDKIGKTHCQVFEGLREQGIGVNLHYIPVHTHPYYQRMGFQAGDYPEAEKYYAEAISLPLYQTLTFDLQDQVIVALNKVLET